MIVWPAKDAADIAEYTWTPALDTGDNIVTFTPSVASGDVTIDSTERTSTTGTVWLSGGTTETIINLHVMTAGGRDFDDAAVIQIVDRAAATLAQFRLRYPAFSGVADGVVAYWLADAGGQVNSGWNERDTAILALAAHNMAVQGVGTVSAIPAGVTSFKSGTFAVTISDTQANATGYDASIYGREFKIIARRNTSGPRIAMLPC
jgi:hypothetical protein